MLVATIAVLATLSGCLIFWLIFLKEKVKIMEQRYQEESEAHSQDLFDEMIETLSYTIDAKDRYTRGHSQRVAEYSRMIAKRAGMSESDCRKIYHTGLVHDIGKIAVPGYIINKPGKLTEDEYAKIKEHPERGALILEKMDEMPYLSEGAKYHHERYDGKGYPEGLSGENIPLFARIIAVADAYDAMTSARSYRNPLSQDEVRAEIIKGRGTQFDPTYAAVMLELMDIDFGYEMREKRDLYNSESGSKIIFEKYREYSTDSWEVNEFPISIKFFTQSIAEAAYCYQAPSAILFYSDSTDVTIDFEGNNPKGYREIGGIRADGAVWQGEAVTMQFSDNYGGAPDVKKMLERNINGYEASLKIERFGDHIRMTLFAGDKKSEAIFVLPEDVYKVYAAITGYECAVSDIEFERSRVLTREEEIPFIMSHPSYIEGEPVGDIPNVESNALFAGKSEAISVRRKTSISAKTKSFKFANRFWYSPIMLFYTAEDKRVDGLGYRQLFASRSDGYTWTEVDGLEINSWVEHSDDFSDWDDWLYKNRKGTELTINAGIDSERRLSVSLTDAGTTVRVETKIPENFPNTIYLCISGELCAITDIHITDEV